MLDEGPTLATGSPSPGRCCATFPKHHALKTYQYWDGRRLCARHLVGLIGPQMTLANGYAGPGRCRSGHSSVRVWALGDGRNVCGTHLRESIRIATWPRPPETLR